jgi:hypothetical protein
MLYGTATLAAQLMTSVKVLANVQVSKQAWTAP